MSSIRLGLCCIFKEQPIKFSTTTATHIAKQDRPKALAKLSALCLGNAQSLLEALKFCKNKGIGCFRINSHVLPCFTHPEVGYKVNDLPDGKEIVTAFETAGNYARENNIRTCFHPDQFVVLNSPNADTVKKSIADIEYQTEVAQWVNADVINIHGGGAYGDKKKALYDFATNFYRLSTEARKRLTVENDDKTYTPEDLLPLCETLGIPLVYDVHHHRCNPDDTLIQDATEKAVSTWDGREPMFHISSPINGYGDKDEASHHDYIAIKDFPKCWTDKTLTVEVEAKAKELAVCKLLSELMGI